jgi:hypothetical protein
VHPMRVCDIVVSTPHCKVAIEVDGPPHFNAPLSIVDRNEYTHTNTSIDGPTQLRNWTLHKLGYEVVSVPFFVVPWSDGRYHFNVDNELGANSSVMEHLDSQIGAVFAQAHKPEASVWPGTMSPILQLRRPTS